ncbi:nucleotide exchange factor GrpE [Methylobacterium sp. J-026]|uniref:nucleotide exchange factor GrpE n=1 Tax=Methylobacterium sp. J-026 TaxID=2836624 RepID=UPI001FBAA498|nr:nucleotide exchange factor GrpE [Methylobacterium sp. J-026]MCJ2136942.1 nucleotide exchange factor GrpE [Methylobacterium sp. J-026]
MTGPIAEPPTEAMSPASEAADLAALQAENASLQDRLMRALAESENVRRRGERRVEEAKKFAVQGLAGALLPVVDNLGRAVAAAMSGQGVGPAAHASLLEGVGATERMLTGTLERFGIQRIPALGMPFDPKAHEAMREIEDAIHPPGIVLDVMEDGFTLHDRLLRPARVSVAKVRSGGGTPG